MTDAGRQSQKTRITIIDYNAETLTEKDVQRAEECAPFKDNPTVTWINVEGLTDGGAIETIGKAFDLHPLVLENIPNPNQRPKLEEYPNCLFVVLKMFSHHVGTKAIEAEQVSLILGPNFVISFQDWEGDAFDAVRDRIRNSRGRIRTQGADYLLYRLIDAVVDGYFLTCEELGEEVEALEDEVLADPRAQVAAKVHQLRRKTIFLRQAIWPLREAISGLMREDSPLIRPETRIFLRDVYDHTIEVIETVESARDIIGGLLDIYLSSISYRLNEVMKVLTIIATIFIPLTFLVGVYGMNFHYMPELGWRYGYPAVWVAIVASAGAMLLYFHRKGWM